MKRNVKTGVATARDTRQLEIIEYPDMGTGEMIEVKLSPEEKLNGPESAKNLIEPADYNELFEFFD